jgi:hypothetical protein
MSEGCGFSARIPSGGDHGRLRVFGEDAVRGIGVAATRERKGLALRTYPP